jgi:hypothetical protein
LLGRRRLARLPSNSPVARTQLDGRDDSLIMAEEPKAGITVELEFDVPYRRAFFNTFELDKISSPGFVISHFALVISRECIDRLTIVMAQKIVDLAKENLIKYVNEAGLRKEASAINLPPISILSRGHVDVADTINCSRSESSAEITFHAFSLQQTVAAQLAKKPMKKVPLVAFARCATPLQIKWILALYE